MLQCIGFAQYLTLANMFKPKTISEKLLFSTVRIETSYPGGSSGSGTGFFYKHEVDDTLKLRLIITNKHVVNGSTTAKLLIHIAKEEDGGLLPSGEFTPVNVADPAVAFEGFWVNHPDPNIDLCAMLVGTQLEHSFNRYLGKKPYVAAFNSGNIPTQDFLNGLSAIEDVYMFGYPNGMYDKKNYLPIVRRGLTASHAAVDFDGESCGVVDMACFPGSSGSPICVIHEDHHWGANIQAPNIGFLLGVLFAGPTIDQHGRIERRDIPTLAVPIPIVQTMIHLGYYVKAREVPVLANELVEEYRKRGQIPPEKI